MRKGWQTKKIGEVCSLMTGGTPSKSRPEYFGGDIKWLVSGDIHQREIFDCEGRITEDGMRNSNAKVLPLNSVMIALNGQGKTRGTVALLRTEATCNQSLVSISPNDPNKLMPEFLYANLHGRYQELRTMTGDSGNERRGLNMILLKGIDIPIAPLAEQRRIVGLLDEAFAGLATAQANVDKNHQNARALFESYLQSVFSQRGKRWPEKTLGDFCAFENGDRGANYPSKSVRSATGIPFINAGHLTDDGIDFEAMDYIPRERFDLLSNGKIRKGDILFCLRGSLGKFASVGDLNEGAIASSLVIVRPDKTVLNQYLLAYFHSSICADMVSRFKNGAAQPNLSARSLREFIAPVPTLEEQKQVIEELGVLHEETKRLADLYEQKRGALEALKKSLLHRAFSGEL